MAITQQQIAELAGVSRGTVDRVLNNRGHVSPEVEARIRHIASTNDYRPNRSGCLLVRARRHIKLGVIIQSVATPFMHTMLEKLEQSRGYLSELGADLIIRSNPNMDSVFLVQAMDGLRKEGIDGLAITAMASEEIDHKINELSDAGIPVVTFNSDSLSSSRICYVGQDNYISGRTCAGLMNLLLAGKGTVLMLSGYSFSRAHQQRIDGFRSEILSEFRGITLLPLEFCNDDSELAYEIVKRMLTTHPEISGIYCASNGQLSTCRAILELGLIGKVHFICHDMSEDNNRNVKIGLIDFLIDQEVDVQARLPLEILVNKIIYNENPPHEYMHTRIDIRNKYNISS